MTLLMNVTKKVDICNVSHKIGTFVVTNLANIEKEFGKIVKIIKLNNSIVFRLQIFEEITFDEHVHAYIVKQCTNTVESMNQNHLPKASKTILIILQQITSFDL